MKTDKKVLLFVLPYSFSFRNYFMTGYIPGLGQDYNVHVHLSWHLVEENELERHFPEITFKPIQLSNRKRLTKFLYTIAKSRLLNIQSTYSYRIKKKNRWQLNDWKEIVKLDLLKFPFASSGRTYRLFRKLYQASLFSPILKRELDQVKPDVIVMTQTNWNFEGHYAKYAENNEVKTVNLVHSWDVVTTKGAYMFNYDKVVVWNRLNFLEYDLFVNRINGFNSEIEVIPPLHFEQYKQSVPDATEVKKRYNISGEKRVILYATSVERLYPKEVDLVNKLIDFVRENQDFFLLVRVHPQLKTDAFDGIENSPYCWIDHPDRSKSKKTLDLVNFEANFFDTITEQIGISDVVINMASTFSLDAMAMNKPVILLGIDMEPSTFYTSIMRYYHLDHYRVLFQNEHIGFVRTFEELTSSLLRIDAIRPMNLSWFIPTELDSHNELSKLIGSLAS